MNSARLRLLYDDDGSPRVIEGNDKGLLSTVSMGPPFAGGERAIGERG